MTKLFGFFFLLVAAGFPTAAFAAADVTNDATTAIGPIGGVTILKGGTEMRVFASASDSDTARGAALMLAWESFGPGDSMFIDPGTYEVNGTEQYLLSGYGGQTVAGAGMDVTIIKMGIRSINAEPLYNILSWYGRTKKGGANHVTVRDLTLDGNLQNQIGTIARASGIYGFGSHFLVERVHTINFGTKGAASENFTIFLGGSGHGPDFGNAYDCVIRDCVADHAWGISTFVGSGISPFIIGGENISANTLTAPPSWKAIGTSSSSATTTTVTTSVPHRITPASPVTVFDGDAVHFSADPASNIVTLHGAVVTQEIVGGLLQISGGPNYIPGFYNIDAQSGTTVTLRKPPCSAVATGGIGIIVPQIHASVTIRGHSLAQLNGPWLPLVTGPNTFVIPTGSTGGTGGEVIEESGWVFGAKILNCVVRNIGAGVNQPPFVHGAGFAWVADGEITGCTFENLSGYPSGGSGIYEDTGAIYGHRYHDNRFINCTLPLRLVIANQPAITDLDIFDNVISIPDGVSTEAILVYGVGVTGYNIRIRGNTIHAASGGGIGISHLEEVLIENNTIDVGLKPIHVFEAVSGLTQRRNKTSAGVVVGTALELWRAAKFMADVDDPAIAGDHADPDRDGVKNLIEYAFGLDPKTADRPDVHEAIESPGVVSLTYTKVLAATDIAYIVERADSPDESWTAASPVNEILSDNGVVQRIKAKVPTNEPLRTFLRLRVAH